MTALAQIMNDVGDQNGYVATLYEKSPRGSFGSYQFQSVLSLKQRRLDSLLGESGRMSRPIKLRYFPHARMKFVSTKIYIPLINIDFFRFFMQFFLEISLYATFRIVNNPLERFLQR